MFQAFEFLSLALIALLTIFHWKQLKIAVKTDRELTSKGTRSRIAVPGISRLYLLYSLAILATSLLLLISCILNLINFLSVAMALGCLLMDVAITRISQRRQRQASLEQDTLVTLSFADTDSEALESRYTRWSLMASGLAFVYLGLGMASAGLVCSG